VSTSVAKSVIISIEKISETGGFGSSTGFIGYLRLLKDGAPVAYYSTDIASSQPEAPSVMFTDSISSNTTYSLEFRQNGGFLTLLSDVVLKAVTVL
jgi:hypothetical protein